MVDDAMIEPVTDGTVRVADGHAKLSAEASTEVGSDNSGVDVGIGASGLVRSSGISVPALTPGQMGEKEEIKEAGKERQKGEWGKKGR